eukprot:TRINITY_DN45629_c0_g1_i1.p1 TRINITY_DN45629_c0_g1~~TRINITY_DN45629_c0_g1_i1.p1  ORF type:complete len:202 (+),score=12.63 TRINITY_DN45629_c0_g1_i1:196-801(+)
MILRFSRASQVLKIAAPPVTSPGLIGIVPIIALRDNVSCTLRLSTSGRRAVRYRERVHRRQPLQPLKYLDMMLQKLDQSEFGRSLKETSWGSHLSIKKLAKAGIAIGVSAVLGGLVILAVFQNHLTKQTANMTAQVTTDVLHDEQALNQIRDMVHSVLKEPSTKKAVRDIWSEVLDDPSVHASLGSCMRGGLWHTYFRSRN